MKKFFRNLPGILVPIFICSCSADNSNKNAGPEKPAVNNTANTAYTLIITTKKVDSENKNYFVSDSSLLEAATDSAAYINALIKYNRYVTNWQTAPEKNIAAPVSFKVINTMNENVLLNLSISQKVNIDAVVKTLIAGEKPAQPDSINNFHLINNAGDDADAENVGDSTIKTKPAGNKRKPLHARPGGSTYIPI